MGDKEKDLLSMTQLEIEATYSVGQLIDEETRRQALKLHDMRQAEKGLPKAYTLVQGMPRHVFTDYLEHIERLAYQGLNIQQIADRLGTSLAIFRDALERFADLDTAVKGGRARAADELTGTMMKNAVADRETTAAKFMLQTRHDFNVPKDKGNTVNVNFAAPPSAIFEEAGSLIESQLRILNNKPEITEEKSG